MKIDELLTRDAWLTKIEEWSKGDGGFDQELTEVIASGMVGIHELMEFMRRASEQQKTTYNDLLRKGDKEGALRLMSEVLGVKMNLSMFRGKVS